MLEWIEVGCVDDIPVLGSRSVATAGGRIALFRIADGSVFALHDRCPHRGGPLSEGIVHGHQVTCPLHSWVIDLASGEATAPDRGCAPTVPVQVVDGVIHLRIPVRKRMVHG